MADAATPTATPPPDTRNLTDEVRRALENEASGLPAELLEERQSRQDEYKDWIAVEAIDYGGARAYNVGDAVPASNVEKFKYDQLGWAAKRTSKAGKAALASLGIEG